jgi:hypothetical protein
MSRRRGGNVRNFIHLITHASNNGFAVFKVNGTVKNIILQVK